MGGDCEIVAGLSQSGRRKTRAGWSQISHGFTGFLENFEVRRWLNGIEPAWTLLGFDSFNALHDEPSANNQAIRLDPDLTAIEISGSAVTANALLLLRRAQ